MKVHDTPKPAPPPTGPGHYILERTANILTGPWRPSAGAIEKKEESMVSKGTCKNCGREMTIVGGGCCFTCYHRGKGLEGEKKDAALAAVKEAIERGEIGKGKRRSGKPVAALTPKEKKEKMKLRKIFGDGGMMPHRVPVKDLLEDTPSILLVFAGDRDRKIYDALIEKAERLRRTPEQQILWMLQNAIEQEAGLLAEASGE